MAGILMRRNWSVIRVQWMFTPMKRLCCPPERWLDSIELNVATDHSGKWHRKNFRS